MVKFTKSNPNSKRKGVKKETMSYIAVFQCNIYTKPDGYEATLGVISFADLRFKLNSSRSF